MNKPHIIYFVADQLRSDALHHLGNPASQTPNMDSLAEEGVSFQHAYCQNPVCVPSRTSFLTGLYPHTTGHRTMHFLQNEDEPNILKEMKNNGYEVVWVGRNDVIPADRDKSAYCDLYIDSDRKKTKEKEVPEEDFYSFYLGETEESETDEIIDKDRIQKVCDYLQQRKSDKPLFLYVTLALPHPPYGISKEYYGKTDRSKLPIRRPSVLTLKDKASMLKEIAEKQKLSKWTEEKWNELRGTYLDMVCCFDDLFGRFTNVLKECGYYDDSYIFLFSDHGDYTGDYQICEKAQNSFEDPVSNVPLIIKAPKNVKIQPRISNSLVELCDLSATVAKIAGFDLSYHQFGKSLLHLLSKEEEHKDAVFCEGGRVHGEKMAMELGHGPQSRYWPRLSTQAMEDAQHTKAIMMRFDHFKYIYRLYEKYEFYDL